MRSRLIPLVATLVVTVLVVGCSSGRKSASTSDTTSTSAASSTTTTSTTSPMPTGVVSSTQCSSSALSASVGVSQAGAGQRYAALVLTNTGSKTCDLKGFPGVSLLDSSANQIGEPAGREGAEGSLVTLDPGGSASTTLHTSAPGLGPTCEPASTQIKIYPPDNTVAIVIPAVYTSCGGFHVTSLVPGTGGN